MVQPCHLWLPPLLTGALWPDAGRQARPPPLTLTQALEGTVALQETGMLCCINES